MCRKSKPQRKVSNQDDVEKILGCTHYRRNAKLQAECCGMWVACRLCHDEISSHVMDRFATKRMCCLFCQSVQPPQQFCRTCNKRMARYYCYICKFWDDAPEKDIYHCKGCGICRIGKGPDIDFKHCYKCTLCVPMHMYESHQCVEYNSKADCPLCGEYLFTSVKPMVFMKCQHMIHKSCYVDLTEDSFQCPVCFKSLDNAKEVFAAIEKSYSETAQPYEHLRREITCFDCTKTSIVKLHILYHKCEHCGSYSTKITNTFNKNYFINKKLYNLGGTTSGKRLLDNCKMHRDGQESITTLIDQMEKYTLEDSEDSAHSDDYFDHEKPTSKCSCSSKSPCGCCSEFSGYASSSCHCNSANDWSSEYS